MNKITFSTLCWKRPEVFEMWCKNMTSLTPKPTLVVTGSDHDQCKEIAERYGVIYERTQNKMLGAKANLSVQMAKETDCTHVVLTGSDDLMSQKMYEYYLNFKGDCLGLLDFYFLNLVDGRMIHWMGYRANKRRIGEPIGAHKMYSRRIMDLLEWKPFDDNNRHPDEHHTELKLDKLGIERTNVRMEDTGGIGVDLKNEANITRFALWENSKYVVPQRVFENEPELWSMLLSNSKGLQRHEEARLRDNRRK